MTSLNRLSITHGVTVASFLRFYKPLHTNIDYNNFQQNVIYYYFSSVYQDLEQNFTFH